ncbi:MAG: hypothetical protein ACI9P5_004487 [Saprospiraceae bacterium]|jgi:hypothetical protein
MEAFRRDQAVRNNKEVDFIEIDKENQQTVISLLENCGWPTNKKPIEGIWFVIQHAGSGFMAYLLL